MWILTWLPDWVTHAIFFAGAAGIFLGFVLTFIPFVKQYKLAIQIASLFVFALGVYLEGAMADNNEWLDKVKELEAKVAIAEEKSKTANVVVEEKIVTKTQVVKEKAKTIVQYVDREVIKNNDVIKFNETCIIPKIVIDTHNQAATMNQGDKK